ncbi:MAG: CDP-alcohol phosphatidyltransferase family protein [Meiothermus sp.]|nr:CDP-alcohol phosphatidyltransferase family protein [Meiothermus sp.]
MPRLPRVRWYKRPNWLTLSRMGLALILPFIFQISNAGAIALSCLLLALMGLTDLLDGYFARKYGLASRGGELIDSTADGFARLTVLVLFLDARLIPLWMVLAVFWRDMVSWSLRFMDLAQRRAAVRKRLSGKVNGTAQSAAISLIMLALLWAALAGQPYAAELVWLAMLAGATTALWSGLDLLITHRQTLRSFLRS